MMFFSAVRPLNPPILGDFNSSFPQKLAMHYAKVARPFASQPF